MQQIAAAHLERIEAKLTGHAVEQHFKAVACIDAAMAAHGSAGRQIGVDAIAIVFDRRDVIQTLQQRAGVENGDDTVAGVRAAALHEFALAGTDAPIALESKLEADGRLRPRTVRQEIFLAREFHEHSPLGRTRQ